MITRTHADLQAAFNAGADLEAATYYCNPSLYGPVALQSNTNIKGRGRGSTVIKLADGVNPSSPIAFVSHGVLAPLPACGYYKEKITLSSLTVDGNRANNTGLVDGLQTPGIKDCNIEDIETINCSEVGLVHGETYSDSGLDHTRSTARAIFAHDNTEGMQIAAGSISDSFSYSNDGSGVRLVAQYSEILKQPYTQLSNVISTKNGAGFLLEAQLGQGKFPTTLLGCVAHLNTQGLVAQIEQVSVMGGSYTHNSEYNVYVRSDKFKMIGATVKNGGIGGVQLVGDINDLILMCNTITDDRQTKTQQYAISDTALTIGGHNNLIAYNDLRGNALGAFSPGMAERGSAYEIRRNNGHNPVGEFNGSVSGSVPYFSYTAGASPETLYIVGGDVYNIVKRGISIGAATRTIHLEPGERVDIASNTTPTIVRSIH